MGISFTPLWETMKKKGKTTYDLRYRWKIGGGTYERLRTNQSVSTNTIEDLCKHLDCDVNEIMIYIKDTDK